MEIYLDGSQIVVSTRFSFHRIWLHIAINIPICLAAPFVNSSTVYCTLSNSSLIFSSKVCPSVAQACDREYSHVVVTTKAIPELTSTSTLLSSLLSPPYSDRYPQPTYVLLQNGLNVEVDLYNAIKKLGKGEPKIISTAVYIATNITGENVVLHTDYVRFERVASCP